MWTAVWLLAVGAPDSGLSGVYRTEQIEVAGGLELRPDGRFRYVLDYGAVSEEAEGAWAAKGNGIELTTEPMPPASECDRGFAKACFRQTPLALEGDDLILIRWDARIVLKPLQPRPR